MSVSIRHRGIEQDGAVESASLIDCLSAMKRGFDSISTASSSTTMLTSGAPMFDPVVEIDDLREQRRTKGYQAEDGTSVMRGVDDNDLYNEEWLAKYLASEKMLSRNPFYRFAMMVASQTGRSSEEMLDQSQIQRETVSRAKAAAIRLAELKKQQLERDTTPNAIEFQEKRYEKARDDARALSTFVQELETARMCFSDRTNAPDIREKANAILKPLNSADNIMIALFDTITRNSIIANGISGYQTTHQRLRDTLIAAFNLFVTENAASPQLNQLKEGMPRTSNMALNLAVLRYSATRDDLLSHITTPETRLFPADSTYAKEPFLYGDDLVTLSKLFFERGAASGLLFQSISFLFYAHLNRMRKNAGYSDEFAIARPKEPEPETRRRGANRIVNGRSIVFDIGDDELIDMVDSPQLYPKDKLAEAQNQLFENVSVTETAVLIDRLLDPMYRLLVPHLFYTPSDDRFATYAGTSVPGNTLRVLYRSNTQFSLPLVSVILLEAMTLIKQQAFPDSRENIEQGNEDRLWRAVAAVFTTTPPQETAFARKALGELIRDSGVLECVALYIVMRANVGEPLAGIDKVREETLRAFLRDTKNNEAAYAIFSSAFMSGPVNPNRSSNALFAQKSHQRLQEIIETETQGVVDRVKAGPLKNLEQAVAQEKEVLERQRQERKNRMLADQQHQELHLDQVLAENYVPTASVALSARNTGVLIFSHLLTGAINASYQDLELYVPCVADTFRAPAALILSDEYWCAFASLVQARVRLISVRNPVVYQAVIAEKRSRMGVRSELDTIRQVAGLDRSIRHINGRCTCNRQTNCSWQSKTRLVDNRSIF